MTIYEWHRSGARLKVEITSFAILSPFETAGPKWMVAFDVANNGRTATTAHSVGLQRPKGGVFVIPEPAAGPNPLPKRLEPGASFTYPVEVAELHKTCRQEGVEPSSLVPYVSTGHGQFMGKWKKVALEVVEKRKPGALPDLPGRKG